MAINWTVPSAFVAGGLFLGLTAERFVLPQLRRYAVARRWMGGDLVIASLQGVTLTFFLIAGIYTALLAMPLRPIPVTVVHQGFLVALIPLGTIVLELLLRPLHHGLAPDQARRLHQTEHGRRGARGRHQLAQHPDPRGPNNMIIVPNAKLAAATVTNYYQPDPELVVIVPASVGYESDLDRVEQVTLDVARGVMREIPGGAPTFEPLLRYNGFGETSVNFNVIIRAREVADQARVKHEFVKRLHERFGREGIPFRSRAEVYLRDGNGAVDPLGRGTRASRDVRQ